MRLPPTTKRAGLLIALAIAASGLVALTISAQAGAHPGPVDTSGGHYCTQAQYASGLCRPPTYHRHEEGGNIVVATPGPEAAQLTGQPFTPGGTQTTAPGATVPPGTPVAAPLADTGPIDLRVALFGASLLGLGLMAIAATRRIPLPVVLELHRA